MLNFEKCKNSRKLHILFLIISLKPFKLQRCTIPHFKALDLLFWPLAWLLTPGSIVFTVWCKSSVYFFLNNTKVIALIVKTQAKGQNNLSRALKWGIVHLCSSNRIGDMIKNKKCNFLDFRIFCNFA